MVKHNIKQKVTVFFEPSNSLEKFFKNIDKAIASGAKSLLLLSADENNFNKKAINDKLKTIPITVFGGIFPQIIYQNDSYMHGSIVCGLDFNVQTICLESLSDPNADYEQQISTFAKEAKKCPTMMIFVDGNSKYIAALMEKIYDFFNSGITYLGGGAGTLKLKTKPCLFSNQGLLADGAQLIAINHQALIRIEHGFEKVAGPFIITESDHNVIKMIDYQPAYEVYKKVVENDGVYTFTKNNFFDVAKNYPLGIEKIDGSFIIRDPIKPSNNDLICVAEVPENSIVYLLKGTANKLIKSASKASNSITKKIKQSPTHYPPLLFDCISRFLILEKDFYKELNAINNNLPSKQSNLIGISTIGEIANQGNFCLEFYNKTLVIVSFKEN